MIEASRSSTQDLGRVMRREIARHKLSQYRIAKDTGIKQPSLSRFVNGGSLRIETAGVLLGYLGFELIRKAHEPEATAADRAATRRGKRRTGNRRHNLPSLRKRQKRRSRKVSRSG